LPKEIKVIPMRLLGTEHLYAQGGTVRAIVPRSGAEVLSVPKDLTQLNYEKPSIAFVQLDKGLLMMRVEDYAEDDEIRVAIQENSKEKQHQGSF
jgi:hypothetical protein